MNVFNKCISQDRNKEEFCLNLANMFHAIKSYYGPYFSKAAKTIKTYSNGSKELKVLLIYLRIKVKVDN
jgi:hypothetical protein